jgi:hypothetical protein
MTSDRFDAQAQAIVAAFIGREDLGMITDIEPFIAAALRTLVEAHVSDLRAIENALDEFEADPPTALRVAGEHVGMALHNLRATGEAGR